MSLQCHLFSHGIGRAKTSFVQAIGFYDIHVYVVCCVLMIEESLSRELQL